MRLFRELMTIAVGQSVSNGVNLGQEKLVGIHIFEDSDAAELVFQCLVSGNLGDAASEVWRDIAVTTTDNPAAGGYVSVPLSIASASVVDNAVILLPPNAYMVPPVIRLKNTIAGTNITGTPFTARLITQPHA